MLADKHGLILDFCIYQGKGTFLSDDCTYSLSVGESAVWCLSQTVPPKSCLYFDRYFTTHKLVHMLAEEKKILSTGTLMRNQVPKTIDNVKDISNEARGTSAQYVREDQKLIVTQWLDSRPITMLSSECGKFPLNTCKRWIKADKHRKELPLPACIANYNNYMGGVDLADRMIAYYRIKSRTNRWTLRVMLHFVDLAAINLWIQCKTDKQHLGQPARNIKDFMDFRFNLAELLIADNGENEEEDSSDENFEPQNVADPGEIVYVPNAVITSQAFRKKGQHLPVSLDLPNAQRCRLHNCKSKSRIFCVKCKIILCCGKEKHCFFQFHA